MIDIIGNIKLNESNPLRVQYFVATLQSMQPLFKMGSSAYLVIETPTEKLSRLLERLTQIYPLTLIPPGKQPYGHNMCTAISTSIAANMERKNYIQFEEDHFFELSDMAFMLELVSYMNSNSVDVCRASFHKIEVESQRGVLENKTISEAGYCFEMNYQNHRAFQHPWPRFYMGTNCIFNKQFALKFWNRPGTRPHEYELSDYSENFKHKLIIPKKEILKSIDDDHGLLGSSMLLSPSPKFKECIDFARNLTKHYYR